MTLGFPRKKITVNGCFVKYDLTLKGLFAPSVGCKSTQGNLRQINPAAAAKSAQGNLHQINPAAAAKAWGRGRISGSCC